MVFEYQSQPNQENSKCRIYRTIKLTPKEHEIFANFITKLKKEIENYLQTKPQHDIEKYRDIEKFTQYLEDFLKQINFHREKQAFFMPLIYKPATSKRVAPWLENLKNIDFSRIQGPNAEIQVIDLAKNFLFNNILSTEEPKETREPMIYPQYESFKGETETSVPPVHTLEMPAFELTTKPQSPERKAIHLVPLIEIGTMTEEEQLNLGIFISRLNSLIQQELIKEKTNKEIVNDIIELSEQLQNFIKQIKSEKKLKVRENIFLLYNKLDVSPRVLKWLKQLSGFIENLKEEDFFKKNPAELIIREQGENFSQQGSIDNILTRKANELLETLNLNQETPPILKQNEQHERIKIAHAETRAEHFPNEDSYLSLPEKNLYAVFDGVSSSGLGTMASILTRILLKYYSTQPIIEGQEIEVNNEENMQILLGEVNNELINILQGDFAPQELWEMIDKDKQLDPNLKLITFHIFLYKHILREVDQDKQITETILEKLNKIQQALKYELKNNLEQNFKTRKDLEIIISQNIGRFLQFLIQQNLLTLEQIPNNIQQILRNNTSSPLEKLNILKDKIPTLNTIPDEILKNFIVALTLNDITKNLHKDKQARTTVALTKIIEQEDGTKKLIIGNIGDSRIYKFNGENRQLECLTEDIEDNYINVLLRLGIITPEQAKSENLTLSFEEIIKKFSEKYQLNIKLRENINDLNQKFQIMAKLTAIVGELRNSKQKSKQANYLIKDIAHLVKILSYTLKGPVNIYNLRNVITQAYPYENLIYNTKTVEVREGDIVVLVTDGVSDNLTDEEIQQIIENNKNNPTQISKALIQEAEKRMYEKTTRSKPDDATALVVRI